MVKLDADAVWEFADAITQTANPTPQKRPATVQSVDADGTVWVQVAGAENVTPVKTSNAMVAPGDVVTVEQRGASLHVEGNITDPAAGGKAVYNLVAPIRASLTQAAEDADAAKLAAKAAQEAAETASAANQHFWDDDNGAHVTEIEKDAWTDPQSADYHSGHNMLLNSLGLLFRKAMNNLASFTQSAVAFFDGLGNDASNVVASFGADGFQAGKANESHLVGDYHSLRLVDKEGNTYFHVSDLRNATGYAEITETFIGDGTTYIYGVSLYGSDEPDELDATIDGVGVPVQIVEWPDDLVLGRVPPAGSLVAITYTTDDERAKAYTLGRRKANETTGGYSFAEGDENIASGTYSHAEGYSTSADGYTAHAEGWSTHAANYSAHAEGTRTTASGTSSHAEGHLTKASGNESHAEGQSTTASGTWSHAEGYGSVASNGYAHAEGSDTRAQGICSHAEGNSSIASGQSSHAQNLSTRAASSSQTAMGKYNVEDANGTYAVIIGNGTADNARSNAHTLDWSGNADYAGEVTAHSGGTAHNLTDKADQADLTALETTVDGMQAASSSSSYTNIAGYDENNQYTFLSDGYVFVYVPASSTAYFTIAGSSGNSVGAIGGVGNYRSTVYVRKGMHGYKNSSVTGSITARFYALR